MTKLEADAIRNQFDDIIRQASEKIKAEILTLPPITLADKYKVGIHYIQVVKEQGSIGEWRLGPLQAALKILTEE